MGTKITDSLEVDDAIVQSADWRLDAPAVQRMDAEILGCEQHLVDSLLSGVVCSWFKLDSGSAAGAAGDVVCLAASSSSARAVTLATTGALAAAGLVGAANPGAPTRVAMLGALAPAITGLAAGSLRFVRVTANRCEAVASLTTGDYAVGSLDSAGNLHVSTAVGSGGGATDPPYGAQGITFPHNGTIHYITSDGQNLGEDGDIIAILGQNGRPADSEAATGGGGGGIIGGNGGAASADHAGASGGGVHLVAGNGGAGSAAHAAGNGANFTCRAGNGGADGGAGGGAGGETWISPGTPHDGGDPEAGIKDATDAKVIRCSTAGIGFYGGAPAAKPTITGSRGSNAALADLLTKLASLGLITDSTS